MLDAIKKLLDSNVINESTHSEIMEAWDSKLTEARSQLKAELREEFAQRYDHDKTVMVEALDKMVTEGLSTELAEFNTELQAMAADRVKFQKSMNENVAKFNNFVTAKLAEEISELRKDRKKYTTGIDVVESFVAKNLTREIREFAEDKRQVVETKVKLVAEARTQLEALKKRFVNESAAKVQKHIKTKLSSELSALQEDIKSARENNFGRRIFEAFMSEFQSTHLNENAEIRKLQNALKESSSRVSKLKTLTESKEKEIRKITESNKRIEMLSDLLAPLNAEKREVMENLLENVQTSRLSSAFEKYLPAVLSNNAPVTTHSQKKMVTEGRKEVTGDKTAKVSEGDSNIIEIRKLAGLKV